MIIIIHSVRLKANIYSHNHHRIVCPNMVQAGMLSSTEHTHILHIYRGVGCEFDLYVNIWFFTIFLYTSRRRSILYEERKYIRRQRRCV
jgi:hypothetical protein